MKHIKGDVDASIGTNANITFHQLCSAGRNKYLNMMAAKEYNKIDLKSTRLMTLATNIEHLEGQLKD